MNEALFRAFFDCISQDEEIMGYLGLTVNSPEIEKREKIIKHFQSEYIKTPRIVFLANVYSRPNPQVPALREKIIRIHVQTNDATKALNEKILERINILIEEETLQIDSSHDNVKYWSSFTFEQEGASTLMLADMYDYFYEYSISVAPKVNVKEYRG